MDGPTTGLATWRDPGWREGALTWARGQLALAEALGWWVPDRVLVPLAADPVRRLPDLLADDEA